MPMTLHMRARRQAYTWVMAVAVLIMLFANPVRGHATPRPWGSPLAVPVAQPPASFSLAGLTIDTGDGMLLMEPSLSDSFTVALSSVPTSDVTVTIVADGMQVRVDAPTDIVFTADDWNVPQTISVHPIDDDIVEGVHAGSVSFVLVSADPAYDGRVVSDELVDIVDDDIAGVAVTQSDGSTLVSEDGGSDTYDVSLTAQPATSVTVTIQDVAGQVLPLPAELTFTPSNWNVPQSVIVTAIDDSVDEGSHTATIEHLTTSSDPNFDGLSAASVIAAIIDNDGAQVLISQSSGSTAVTEGVGSDAFQVSLSTAPTANVTVTLIDDGQVDISQSSLVFTPANWNTPQVVSVTATNDSIDEPSPHAGTIAVNVSSADVKYSGLLVASIAVAVTDNDTAGVSITQTGGNTSVSESGATDTYTIVLTSQPTATVQLTIGGGSQLSTTPTTLSFTSANWSVPRTVTVAAINDAFAEGAHTGLITHAISSLDAGYLTVTAPTLSVPITDDDDPGITVVQTGITEVSEYGDTDIITVRLATQPQSSVTVSVIPSATVAVSTGTLTFAPGTWNIPQSVTVSAVDDLIPEGSPHSGVISFVLISSDTQYDALPVEGIEVNVDDNDEADLVVTQSDGFTDVTEGGATDTISIALATPVDQEVEVFLLPDEQTDTDPSSITFTPDDWNVAQDLTVRAVDDQFDEEDVAASVVSIGSTSFNNEYDNINVPDVDVAVHDDDAHAIRVERTGTSNIVKEGGAIDSLRVRLATRPRSNVKVATLGDSQIHSKASVYTFTPSNWNRRQSIKITAVNDARVEGRHSGRVRFTVTSSDKDYNAYSIAARVFTVLDNDKVAAPSSGGSTGGSGSSGGSSGSDGSGGNSSSGSTGTVPGSSLRSSTGRTSSGRSPSVSGSSSSSTAAAGAFAPAAGTVASTASTTAQRSGAAKSTGARTSSQSGTGKKAAHASDDDAPIQKQASSQRADRDRDRSKDQASDSSQVASRSPVQKYWWIAMIPVVVAMSGLLLRTARRDPAAVVDEPDDEVTVVPIERGAALQQSLADEQAKVADDVRAGRSDEAKRMRKERRAQEKAAKKAAKEAASGRDRDAA